MTQINQKGELIPYMLHFVFVFKNQKGYKGLYKLGGSIPFAHHSVKKPASNRNREPSKRLAELTDKLFRVAAAELPCEEGESENVMSRGLKWVWGGAMVLF